MRDAARRGLAIGFFDGVHRGHQAILAHAASVLTFRTHPLAVLAPARAPRLLMPLDARLAAIRACGVASVDAVDFTPELARMPAADFLTTVLLPRGAPDGVWCGANWRFGCGGEGDAAFLRARGLPVSVVPAACWDGAPISSTRIRAALEDGAPDAAAQMLGRPWRLTGRVVSGKGLGRRLGLATVNLRPDDLQLNLPRGVYAVEALGRRAVANYGLAPTMGAQAWERPVLEIHFPCGLGADETHPSPVSVSFLRFLRPERTFPSLEALVAQVRRDIAAAGA
jgi:riboflavin kinase/FMN adenylyltransferase